MSAPDRRIKIDEETNVNLDVGDVKWPEFRMPKEQFLTKTNYQAWRATWTGVLTIAGIPIKPTGDATINVSEVVDITMGWKLKETMTKETFGSVATLTSGQVIWRQLQVQLGVSRPALQMSLLDQIHALRLKRDAAEYTGKFHSFVSELRSLGITFHPLHIALIFIRGAEAEAPDWAVRIRSGIRTTPDTPLTTIMAADLTDEFATRKSAGKIPRRWDRQQITAGKETPSATTAAR